MCIIYKSCSSEEKTERQSTGWNLAQINPRRVPGPQLNNKILKDDLGFTTPLDFFRLLFSIDVITMLCNFTCANFEATGMTKKSYVSSCPNTDAHWPQSTLHIIQEPVINRATFFLNTDHVDRRTEVNWLKLDFYMIVLSVNVMYPQKERTPAKSKFKEPLGNSLILYRTLRDLFPSWSAVVISMDLNPIILMLVLMREWSEIKGDRYSFRQHIKDKPTKWGMKWWVLADSCNGYTYDHWLIFK